MMTTADTVAAAYGMTGERSNVMDLRERQRGRRNYH